MCQDWNSVFSNLRKLYTEFLRALRTAGANPAIAIDNAGAVNFYNATDGLARFENKNILFYLEKRCSLIQRWRCSCKYKSRRIGSSF
jgi:hypothetical protein